MGLGSKTNTYGISQQGQASEQRLDALENLATTSESDIADLREDLDTLSGLVAQLDARLDAIESRRPIQMIDDDDVTYFDGATGLGSDIWDGWALCDGRNGTPDLRERFIVGYSPGVYDIGDTGGEAEVTLTESQIPEHYHEISSPKANGTSAVAPFGYSDNNGAEETNETDEAGGGQPHENRPPYYSLAFVKKL